jgi:hypothetical protein
MILEKSVADPDPGFRIRDEHQMNITNHISSAKKQFFVLKIHNFFDGDPESF